MALSRIRAAAALLPLVAGVGLLAACSGLTPIAPTSTPPPVVVVTPLVDVSQVPGAPVITPVPDAGQAAPPGGVPSTTLAPQATPYSYP